MANERLSLRLSRFFLCGSLRIRYDRAGFEREFERETNSVPAVRKFRDSRFDGMCKPAIPGTVRRLAGAG